MGNRISFLLVVLIIIYSITMYAKEYESPIYTQYAVEIIRSFSNQVEKEFDLECVGSGGSMPHDVEEISIDFIASQNATVPQARELEVKLTEKFVQMINAHEKIRPFLREYPFTAGRTCVTLSFKEPKKGTPFSVRERMVTFVFHVRDKIFYKVKNPNNPYLFKTVKEEPYEEALKIVQSQITKNTP